MAEKDRANPAADMGESLQQKCNSLKATLMGSIWETPIGKDQEPRAFLASH